MAYETSQDPPAITSAVANLKRLKALSQSVSYGFQAAESGRDALYAEIRDEVQHGLTDTLGKWVTLQSSLIYYGDRYPFRSCDSRRLLRRRFHMPDPGHETWTANGILTGAVLLDKKEELFQAEANALPDGERFAVSLDLAPDIHERYGRRHAMDGHEPRAVVPVDTILGPIHVEEFPLA